MEDNYKQKIDDELKGFFTEDEWNCITILEQDVIWMGIYIIDAMEIENKLFGLLDELEGEVYKDSFVEATSNVLKKYKNFTK